MTLEGSVCRLRAVEPCDADIMYVWENDVEVWRVSNTSTPFSRYSLVRFIEEQQQCDIYSARQLRLIIETAEGAEPDMAGMAATGAASAATEKASAASVATSATGWTAVGAVDLFEFDPHNLRAGIGILVYDRERRGRGYAADALRIVEGYAREVLHLHSLWCNVGADNVPSLALFEKAGYVRVGIKRDWMRTPDGFADEIMMQKML